MNTAPIIINNLGLQDYATVWQNMQAFTNQRNADTTDEFWVVEHPPVFTLGQAGKPEHILRAGDIPVIETDRGGQVTYHGPGQLVIYLLLDLRRRKLGVKAMVNAIETSIIHLLSSYGISAKCREGAPGVYVEEKKIAALGLRIRQGCSYHGLSLNIDMDLQPFSRINPCGYVDLEVTQMASLLEQVCYRQVANELLDYLSQKFEK